MAVLGASCTGCGACAAVCPKACIAMEADAAGFRWARVDRTACIDCGRCEQVCPYLTPRPADVAQDVFWAAATDDGLREASSSGGVFGLLARSVIARGGAVYGAAFDEDCSAVRHVRVTAEADLPRVQRSKYVQSVVDAEVYGAVAEDVAAGVPVLFSGVPCQVAGLSAFLDAKHLPRENVLLVDVVCHGAPAPGLWRAYAAWQTRQLGEPLSQVNFRCKSPSWEQYAVQFRGAAGAVRQGSRLEDWYMNAFLQDASLRRSCFACPAKRATGSDITLGDFWGIDDRCAAAGRDLGISGVVCNTAAGRAAFQGLAGQLRCDAVDFAYFLAGNPSLCRSSVPYERYEAFMADVATGDIEMLQRRWTFRPTAADVLKRKCRTALRLLRRACKRS